MPRPGKSLEAHVLDATFRYDRHAGLLAGDELPRKAPARDVTATWRRLHRLIGEYRVAKADRDRRSAARAFQEQVQKLSAELVRAPTVSLHEELGKLLGRNPRFGVSKRMARTAGGRRFARFCERFLVHTKGRWYRQPVVLEGFQLQRIAIPVLSIDPTTGLRRFVEAYVQISKKTGKSTLASGFGLYFLLADGEDGAEVYSLASAKDQARIVFGQARAMVEASPRLQEYIRVYRNELVVPRTESVYRVVSADAGVQEGLNPSAWINDEYHRHKSPDLYETFSSGEIAREQPMGITITNAGADLDSPCGQLYQQARAVVDGHHGARTDLVAYVPELAERDLENRAKWTGPSSPNPASWITLDILERQKKRWPLFVFRRRHLNHWTGAIEGWLPDGAWDACEGALEPEPGDDAFLGIDMGQKHDTAGLVWVAAKDGLIVVRAHSWAVHHDLEKPPPTAHEPLVDTDRVGFDLVENKVRDLARELEVWEAAYDPWRFERSAQELWEEGITMVEYPQTNERMCPASQGLFDAILEGRIVHDGDQVLAAHIRNAVARDTGRGWRLTKRPVKQSGEPAAIARPNDLAIALVMALDRCLAHEGQAPPSFELIG